MSSDPSKLFVRQNALAGDMLGRHLKVVKWAAIDEPSALAEAEESTG